MKHLSFLRPFFLCASFIAGGCAPYSVSTPEELSLFDLAGPVQLKMDVAALVEAKRTGEAYRVVPGDVLQFHMPEVMRVAFPAEAKAGQIQDHVCRVREDGKITLPLIGDIEAGGKTLSEIEQTAVSLYHPRFVKTKPAIVATVKEYRTVKVTITGAVREPGVYDLRSDELSLVAALMKAGGFQEGGAVAVRIYGPGGKLFGEPRILPVEGLNIPFADTALQGGETIEVMRYNPQVVAVLGLVNKPGTFEYPPGMQYNLLQVIAMAQGLDINSGPSYVQVYRQAPDGRILTATFDISGKGWAEAAGVNVKPGDVVYVADTPYTLGRRVLVYLARSIFHVGAYYRIGTLD